MISVEDWTQLQAEIQWFNENEFELEMEDIPQLTFKELRISPNLSAVALMEEDPTNSGNELRLFLVQGVMQDDKKLHTLQKSAIQSTKNKNRIEDTDEDQEEMKFL